MRHPISFFTSFTAITFALAAGCGDGNSSGTGGRSTTSTTDSTGGGGMSTGGTGGATGGTSTGGATGGTGGTTTGGTGGATGGTGGATSTGGGGSAPVGEHVLISEIAVAPEGAEFIEIWNPTAADVDLTDYYLSDNSVYADLAAGQPWTPITNNPGTDFLARFPAGAVLPAGEVRVIGFDPGYEAAYGGCPSFYLGTAALPCGAGMVPAMLATEPTSITDASNLSNAREMVVLFRWGGGANELVQDVDYVTWGVTFEAGSRADKTAVAGYEPDTAPDAQKGAAAPPPGQSIERCAIETGETKTGGNGITGHDETSEDMGASFTVQPTPGPGKKNTCL